MSRAPLSPSMVDLANSLLAGPSKREPVITDMADADLVADTNAKIDQYRESLKPGRPGSFLATRAVPEKLDEYMNACALRGLTHDTL